MKKDSIKDENEFSAYELLCIENAVNMETEELLENCKKEQFLEDPMTRHYGVGYELVDRVSCDCPLCIKS